MKLSGITTLITLLPCCQAFLPQAFPNVPAEAIWKSKVPTKTCFFARAATKGKIPIEDMFKRRNFNGPTRCFMCLKKEETVDHFLIHCSWVSSLWHLSLPLMDVRWLQPFSTKDVIVAWRRMMKKSWAGGIWKIIPLAIWCCI